MTSRFKCLSGPVVLSSLFSTTPALASTGHISFKGTLTAHTCSVDAGGAASGGDGLINLDFGSVPRAQVQSPGIWVPEHGKYFTLVVTCRGLDSLYTQARASFDAGSGSGLDPDDPSLLRLNSDSTARGVGIGLWKPGAATPLDLSSNPPLHGLFSLVGADRVARISIGALYSRTVGPVQGGTASATLPFTLTYE